ncbi:MAG: hypothetical protein Q9175_006564 [Cornicularia normoerica]
MGLRLSNDKSLAHHVDVHQRAGITIYGGPILVNGIRITPFKQGGEPLLFPFLILEAKSAKGDDFDSIQKQTAFPIRTLLQMQADLRNKCGHLLSW